MNIDGVELSLDNLTQDLLELLVGERWPNGDEGAMRSLAAAWSDAAAQLDEIRQTASAAARQVGEHCRGANGDGFQSFWSANFDDGRSSWPSGVAPAALPFAVQFCKSMADALNAGATQIETTKDTIMGNIAILVATVAPQIAAGFFDFGATDATAVAEILADRTAMQVLLDAAKELITEVVEQAIEQGLQQAELNFVIQFKEVMEGHAAGIDWSEVGRSGLSGAEGGALGAGFGFGLGKLGGKAFGEGFGNSVAGRMATGVASGGLTNASLDLIENGKISASDFTKGSLAGVLGGMGGADAAAGQRPAIDTEHLPSELTNPHTPDLTAGVVPTAHTDLSALAAPEVGAGAGVDAAAATSATMGMGTAGWGGAAGESGSSSGARVDPRGGVSFDPSQASAATSSIARILGGGGDTQDAGAGAATSASAAFASPATSPSAGGVGSGGGSFGAGPRAGDGAGVRADTRLFADPAAGVGGLGSSASPAPGGLAAEAGMGGGAGLAADPGTRVAGAVPTSAGMDVSAPGPTGATGYASVGDAGAQTSASAGSGTEVGVSGIAGTGSPLSSQFADTASGAPIGAGLPMADSGAAGGAGVVTSAGPAARIRAGDDPAGRAVVDPGPGVAAAQNARAEDYGGGTRNGAGGGSASDRFYGRGESGDSAYNSSTSSALAEGDRPANANVEALATPTAAPGLAVPAEPVTSRGGAAESADLTATDRTRTGPAEAGISDLQARPEGAGALRGDFVDPVRRDDAAGVSQDPAGETPVRSEPVADDAATQQQPQGVASADPPEPAHSTEPASTVESADESRPIDARPEDVVHDASAPELDSTASDHPTADPGPEPAGSDGSHASDPSRPEQRGPSEPTRIEADAGRRGGDSVTPGIDGAARTGAEPGAPGREAPASPSSDAGGSRSGESGSGESKSDKSGPDAPARYEAKTDGSAAAGPKSDRTQSDAAAESGAARPQPDAAQREAPRGGADGSKSDSGSRSDPGSKSDPGSRSDSGSDSKSDAHHEPVILYQTDLGLGLRDPFEQSGSWNPRQELTGELAQVSARAEVGERGIANFSDRTMAELARKVPPDPDGAFTGDIHGDARGVFSGLTRMTPEEYLRVLDANGHQPGQPIRLLSCEAGAVDDGFAAQLARVSGCKVIAADAEVWSDEAGHLFASGTHTDGFGDPAPDIPPNGTWHEFSPDGTKTEVGAAGFPPGHEEGFGDWGAPVGEVRSRDAAAQDPVEVARAALERLRGQWPELDRALTENPVARDSLLSHPDSVRMLNDALGDVRARLDAAGITDAVHGGEITPEVQAKVDSIVEELRTADPNEVLDRPEQLAISRQIAAGTTKDGYRQAGFDLSRRADPAYQEECVDRLRADAPRSQERLNAIVREIAGDNGGEASWRPQVKDRARALKKVREYVEEVPDGDASLLVDIVGAKIRFGSVDELYKALDALKNDPRLEIVRIKDRVARATESGNRSILMNVRLADGQVAELKFGLKSFEAPAAAEHPLYEVRRDLDSIALAEHRPLTPVESLIKAATEAHARREYGAAWNREMAGSRLHEVLTAHPDVASIAQRLVFDSALHPTNVAKSLADPATRDATIAEIGELADGHALAGRTLDEYRAANPGRGPLFEPVDPSVNTTADGRDRKAVFLDEAKRADPVRDVGIPATPEESARLNEYARRLHEDVHPAVEAEVRRLVEQVGDGASVSIRTKSAEGVVDKVKRMSTGSPSRPARPDYRAGDVIDAVGARITVSDMHDLAQVLEAAKRHFGVGDGGRILEIDNMYASPKSKNPAYRVIPLVVRVEVDGRPYTFELQLTTRRASIAADLEHNTLFKPYVEMSETDQETVAGMLAEAAALDQEETRWNQ